MRALVTLLMAVTMVALGAVSYATEDLLALTNADRSRNGLASLTIVSDLQAYAQGWAEEMMRAGQVSHSADLAAVTNSRVVGENVGQGPVLSDIESAFMASPAHRANILLPDFSEAGVGVVWDGVEHFYVAVIFRQATTAAAPLPAPAEPKPAPAPRVTSSTPTTRLPEATPAPPPVMSPPAAAPPPLPSLEPARVEHPAPLAREAGPRLSWVLAATTGKSVSAADAHDRASPARVVEASTDSAAEDGSSPTLLITVAFLGMVYVSTRILAEARQRFVSRRPAAIRQDCGGDGYLDDPPQRASRQGRGRSRSAGGVPPACRCMGTSRRRSGRLRSRSGRASGYDHARRFVPTPSRWSSWNWISNRRADKARSTARAIPRRG